jgi:hypothetical protein
VERLRITDGEVVVSDGRYGELIRVAAPNGEYMVIRHEHADGAVEIVIVEEGPKIYEGGLE